jgi:hypothetical protein
MRSIGSRAMTIVEMTAEATSAVSSGRWARSHVIAK